MLRQITIPLWQLLLISIIHNCHFGSVKIFFVLSLFHNHILNFHFRLSKKSFISCFETLETTSPDKVEGTMEELLNEIVAQQPVEFDGGVETIDLTDTSEEGQWAIKSSTGLDNAGVLTEAAVFEPMIGSIAFSMVMVRVAPGEDIKSVAEAMKSGINPRKWVCVEADDMLVTGYRDVVMLIMLDTSYDLTAQSFVDAFGKVVGEPEFVI